MNSLSSQAQSIADAARRAYWRHAKTCPDEYRMIAAAVLRATAEDRGPIGSQAQATLTEIASELESSSDSSKGCVML